MGTSRPTAKPHGRCARRRGTRGAHATGIRVGRAVWAHEGGGMPCHAPRPARWREPGGPAAKHRAARIIRVGNGARSGAREGARGGAMWWRGRPSHAPRRGAAARWGHRALPPSRTGGAHGDGAREVRTQRGHGWGARHGRTMCRAGCQVTHRASGAAARAGSPGGAMGTSRPTAKPHGR